MLPRLVSLPRWLRDILPLALWLALIFFLSSQPMLIDVEERFGSLGEKLFYKTAHALFYAVLAWLWWRALAPDRRPTPATLLAAFALTTLYGISDEIHQLFVPGRNGRLTDVIIDASGALVMILLLWRFNWLCAFPEFSPFQSSDSQPNEGIEFRR
jgi:VanZ family protein